MQKILITLDVSKINKDKIKEGFYTTKDGREVKTKNLQIEVVENKRHEFVKSGETKEGKKWTLKKTHFVVESKENKEDVDNYLGNGLQFFYEEDEQKQTESQEEKSVEYPSDEINPDDIPF